jgi:hypothetical protein
MCNSITTELTNRTAKCCFMYTEPHSGHFIVSPRLLSPDPSLKETHGKTGLCLNSSRLYCSKNVETAFCSNSHTWKQRGLETVWTYEVDSSYLRTPFQLITYGRSRSRDSRRRFASIMSYGVPRLGYVRNHRLPFLNVPAKSTNQWYLELVQFDNSVSRILTIP